MPIQNIRNIGIIAHVDAGKTTLTEQLLFASGTIRTAGRVDHGTSQTDSLAVERERGISVRAAVASLTWKDTEIRIIDTPGHADFYAEVERSLSVLDGAILVISSVESVQLQTQTIWRALCELNMPTVIFVNKLDRSGADPAGTLEDIRRILSPAVVPLQTVQNVATDSPMVGPLPVSPESIASLVEQLGVFDSRIEDAYLRDDNLAWSDLQQVIVSQCREGQVFPALFGAAKSGVGVTQLLDAIIEYLPPPEGLQENELSSAVFKIQNEQKGRLTHVRVFEGRIKRSEAINIEPVNEEEKPARVLMLQPGGEYTATDQLTAGDIGVLYGMKKTRVGYVLGSSYASPSRRLLAEPMLTARIAPKSPDRWNDLWRALQILEDEEPLLDVTWQEDQKEINVRFFGEIQMEIIRELLNSRFAIPVSFSKPTVLYKETPASIGEAVIEHRTNGFADIHIRVEPLSVGSGFEFESLVRADKIYYKFVKQIPQILEQARMSGPQGWEVTDFKVTLLDGLSRYDLGTKPGDFKVVTPLVLQKALTKTGTRILEPMMEFEISVPEEYGSHVYRDLVKMRAQCEETLPVEDRLKFAGLVPFAETFEYTATLYATSHGQGVFKTWFHGYFPAGGLKNQR